MYELIAIAGGVVAGVGFASARSTVAAALWVIAGIGAALTAFIVSGEVKLSAGFLLWDLAQVAVAGALSYVVARRLVPGRRANPAP
ncbi:MAG: hypothetical protein M3340_13030 [Actinomycetota bacterium]|nr:hypothetical protein [Actinomycetota bacterium]